ncbi:hypothetical protein AWB81_08204 [Caballeronia arationis]|uniref:hypothetical protein n=1 Tax=Caballeronia arationis TaxID=1777142 RepID=UPI00074BAE85|nr:hypothetical protein [Caballeronia arationis]SAL07639.1 hypothetical protein AWB81_08204 [Caballeronia arationis]
MTIPLVELVQRSASDEGKGVLLRRDRDVRVTSVSRTHRIFSRPARVRCLFFIGSVVACVSIYAQRPELLDPRVTQETIFKTICQPGYLETVTPPLSNRLQWKKQLLRERGVDPETAWQYTFDFHVPVLLGGTPTNAANFEIVRWEGLSGARRKRRLTVLLKRCVCSGETSLMRAQQVISENWGNEFSSLWQLSCNSF